MIFLYYSKTINLGFKFGISTFRLMSIKAVLIDLSGTLHIEDSATPNSLAALEKLRSIDGIIIKFVTNTTKESSKTLHDRLTKIGFNVKRDEIFSSLSAASKYVIKSQLNPYYLVSKDARTDFPEIDSNKTLDAVVVGLAPDEFHYENMNKAFQILLKKNPLIAIHSGKYYKRNDGLALGPGCFIKGLEYSAQTEAILIGKPSKNFFMSAIPECVKPEECVMIGDDINDDIKGAMNAGLQGFLVKTGKYLPTDKIDPPPNQVFKNFAEAVEWLIKNH